MAILIVLTLLLLSVTPLRCAFVSSAARMAWFESSI